MKLKLSLLLILLLAFSIRIFKIDQFPATLYGDEQAFAWNAYNILKTGQDEYGNAYPLHFRSFNDYKAPIPVYLMVPFIEIFGFNTFGIRFLISFASTITVLFTYLLFNQFVSKKISLLGAFLLTISPWHIHLSRGFFESTLSLMFFVGGIWIFTKRPYSLVKTITSSLFFSAALYSYFTPRIYLPIFYLLFFIYHYFFYKDIRKKILKQFVIGAIVIFILSLPLIKLSFFDKGTSRIYNLISANQQKIEQEIIRERYASNLPNTAKVAMHNKATAWLRFFQNNYLEILSANYWYINGDTSLRYFLGNMGMFYLAEMPFFIFGLYFLAKEKKLSLIFFIIWLLVMAIPPAIAGKAYGVRSLSILPAPFIITAYGLNRISFLLSHKKNLYYLGITFVFVVSLGTVLIRYYFEYPQYAATWWGWENKAALDYAQERKNLYDNIFISDFYSGGTLAYAVYNKMDPRQYRYAISNPVTLFKDKKFFKFR